MIEIRPLTQLNLADLRRIGSGYSSDGKYVVTYADSEDRTSFSLQFVALEKPYVKLFHYDDETLRHYDQVLSAGFSFGAFDGDLLVGLIAAEPHKWNRTLWVWEFLVAKGYRGKGIGRRLMECLLEKARQAGFRAVVCETQNTNAVAIKVYRKLGFRIEGIDISYYSNDDYPDGEIALFMKRRL